MVGAQQSRRTHSGYVDRTENPADGGCRRARCGRKKFIRTGFSSMRAAPRIDSDHPAIVGTISVVHLAPLLFKSLS